MSMLEELIGIPLHEVDDDVLEELVMKGRLSMEEQPKTPKVKKTSNETTASKRKPSILDDIDLDDFE